MSCSCHAPSVAVGEVIRVRFRFITSRFSSGFLFTFYTSVRDSNQALVLADPEVVDGSEAGFVHSLDPTMPGLYNCMFSVLAS